MFQLLFKIIIYYSFNYNLQINYIYIYSIIPTYYINYKFLNTFYISKSNSLYFLTNYLKYLNSYLPIKKII